MCLRAVQRGGKACPPETREAEAAAVDNAVQHVWQQVADGSRGQFYYYNVDTGDQLGCARGTAGAPSRVRHLQYTVRSC